MKRVLFTVAILVSLVSSAVAAQMNITPPLQIEFASRLVEVFGGNDKALNKAEIIEVLKFLQANLPEQTGRTSMSSRLNRQNNVYTAARGDMTEERNAIREKIPEHYVKVFMSKYDIDKDEVLTQKELSAAMSNVIGLPKADSKWSKRSIAKR